MALLQLEGDPGNLIAQFAHSLIFKFAHPGGIQSFQIHRKQDIKKAVPVYPGRLDNRLESIIF
jgi:hypothetical protein